MLWWSTTPDKRGNVVAMLWRGDVRAVRFARSPRGAVALVGVLAMPVVPASLRAEEPRVKRIEPAPRNARERRAQRRTEDASEGGRRNGILELTLGSIATTVSAVLIGRGGWELARADEAREHCDDGSIDPACSSTNPARGNYIAAGLSFGFSVPIAIAGGLLLARGVRIHRDYRAHRAREVTVRSWGSADGAGLSVRWRF